MSSIQNTPNGGIQIQFLFQPGQCAPTAPTRPTSCCAPAGQQPSLNADFFQQIFGAFSQLQNQWGDCLAQPPCGTQAPSCPPPPPPSLDLTCGTPNWGQQSAYNNGFSNGFSTAKAMRRFCGTPQPQPQPCPPRPQPQPQPCFGGQGTVAAGLPIYGTGPTFNQMSQFNPLQQLIDGCFSYVNPNSSPYATGCIPNVGYQQQMFAPCLGVMSQNLGAFAPFVCGYGMG